MSRRLRIILLLVVIGFTFVSLRLFVGFGNEFTYVLFICPLIVLISSIIGCLIIKKWFVMPVVTLIIFSIYTFTNFNESFFIWVIIYTAISLIINVVISIIKKLVS